MPQDKKEYEIKLTWLKEKIAAEVFVTDDKQEIFRRDGIKSSWLFDFRNVFLQPEVLKTITDLFWECFEDEAPFQVGGLETAAIPLITAIVLEGRRQGKEVTGFYIRKSRKETGLTKQIEGHVTQAPVILVDDLINYGKSFVQQVEILEREHLSVRAVFTVLKFRRESAYGYFANRGIPIYSLFALPDFSLPFQDDARAKYDLTFHLDWYFGSKHASYIHILPKALPMLKNGNIFWGGDNGHVWCFEQKTGDIKWHQKLGLFAKRHVFASPIYFEDSIFVATYDGSIYKLDAKNGCMLWREEAGERITATPLLLPQEKTVIVGTHLHNGGSIVALDAGSGRRIWERHTEKPVSGTGVFLSATRALISDQEGTFYVLDANGVLETKKNGRESMIGGPVLNELKTEIFWGTMEGKAYKAPVSTFKPTLLFQADGGIYGSPFVHGDKLTVAALDKNVYCIDTRTGTLLWVYETRGRILASPVVHKGVVYIGSNDGRMYALEERTGKEMGFYQTTERITSPVVVDEDGKLLVTTFANELYALSVREKPGISPE